MIDTTQLEVGNRPDTGTRNALILSMAASILQDKAQQALMIAEMFEQQGKNSSYWRMEYQRANDAVQLIDGFI